MDFRDNIKVTSNGSNEQTQMTAANQSVSAFFKAYVKLAPKMKKIKSKEGLAMVDELVTLMEKLNNSFTSKGKKK